MFVQRAQRQDRRPVNVQRLAEASVAALHGSLQGVAEHEPLGRPRRKLIVLAPRVECARQLVVACAPGTTVVHHHRNLQMWKVGTSGFSIGWYTLMVTLLCLSVIATVGAADLYSTKQPHSRRPTASPISQRHCSKKTLHPPPPRTQRYPSTTST